MKPHPLIGKGAGGLGFRDARSNTKYFSPHPISTALYKIDLKKFFFYFFYFPVRTLNLSIIIFIYDLVLLHMLL